MSESVLENLEEKISQIVDLLQKTRLENISLNKKIRSLTNENISLLEKQKKTSESLKKLMLKLQDELVCQTQKPT